MKITFFSNYLTHHQLPFCKEMVKLTEGNFFFVATSPIAEERLKLGYEDMNQKDFVVRAYENDDQKALAEKLCLESDVMIHGSAPEEYYKKRMEVNKLAFRYSERILKNGLYQLCSPRAQKNIRENHSQYRNNNAYLLCSSAFSALDYSRFGAYKDKAYKWGYFPEVKKYADVDGLLEKKRKNSILWAGRLISWKHPEYAIQLAEKLKNAGLEFSLRIIGCGKMEEELKQMVAEKGLEKQVCFLGSMAPEKVREYMEESEFFLFTSDRHEGWGAVLNESMNSGCAVVASHIIGSVPFLMDHGKNGMIYKSGSVKDLYNKTKYLLDHPEERKAMGKEAYLTLEREWNPENAAKRFYALCEAMLGGRDPEKLFENGVCSKAERLKDGWF